MTPFDSTTGYLEPGVHPMAWSAFRDQFFFTEWRGRVGRGMYRALNNLRYAGCRQVIIDGSFVTAKVDPSDFDAAFDPSGVNAALMDPVLRRHDDERRAMKAKYFGDIFPWGWVACSGTGQLYQEFFQTDRSGQPKGVVLLNLSELP